MDETEEPFLAVAVTFGEEQECDHKGKWHIAPGPYKIIRFCGGCGKSWWLPARDDMLGLGPDDRIAQEWEPIIEYREVKPLPEVFYDDPDPFGDDDIEDDEDRPI